MTKRAIFRSYRFRLYPTDEQVRGFGQVIGCCRFVYNLALEQRRDWWRQYRRQTGHPISYFSQSAELTKLRAEVDWIASVPREALDRTLEDLDRAYKAFFSGRAAYPTPRRRSQGCGFQLRARTVPLERLNAKIGRIRLDKLGWVKLRLTRPMIGEPKRVSVREECGAWFVNISCETALDAAEPVSGRVGIDRGVTNTLALSTGELLSLPVAIQSVDRRRRKAQRVLARRKRGSARRGKQSARVATLHLRARRMRTDWLHRVTTDLTRRYGVIAVEALKIKSMTASAAGTVERPGKGVPQKRGLNRSIMAQSWGQFERMLAYKLEAAGGVLIRVPPQFTSQTCQACGAIDAKSRESQAVFRCVACGHTDHADTNAALEILRRSTSQLLAEGSRQRPVETRTLEEAA